MEPWSTELAGSLDEHELESAALRGNPLGDPHERPLWVYTPPAYAAEPDRRFPSIYLIQGHTGQLDMWRNRSAFRPTVPELVDRLFADGGLPAGARRLRRRVDVVRRLAVPRLAGGRATTTRISATRSSRSSTRATARCRRRAPRHHRQVERRLRRDGDADAAPRSLRRPRDARRRRAVRALLPAGLPRRRPRAARRVRRLVRRLLGGLPHPPRLHEGHRLPAAQHVGDGRLLLGERRRLRRPAVRVETGRLRDDVWERWLAWDPVRMVAGTPTPCADCARSTSTRASATSSSSTSARGVPARARAIGVTDVFFELFDGTHSSIEYRYPLALRYLAERLG